MWEREREKLVAEHGLSMLLTIEWDGQRASLVYDAGLGRKTAIHNMDVLQVRLPDLRAVVMSHGHSDHHGGLEGLIRRVGTQGMPLIIHPEAWRERKIIFPTGSELHLPPPSRQDLDREGVEVTEERQPSLIIDGTVLVTGQVERVTDFEKGFPLNYARSNGDALTVVGSPTPGSGTIKRWWCASKRRVWWCFRAAATLDRLTCYVRLSG
jgi:7,8-dihydropterin-6-yl-methyl-4-(beta-D-ribofuranosyl)aminobenzene 5'-phosphate synthase